MHFVQLLALETGVENVDTLEDVVVERLVDVEVETLVELVVAEVRVVVLSLEDFDVLVDELVEVDNPQIPPPGFTASVAGISFKMLLTSISAAYPPMPPTSSKFGDAIPPAQPTKVEEVVRVVLVDVAVFVEVVENGVVIVLVDVSPVEVLVLVAREEEVCVVVAVADEVDVVPKIAM